MLLFVKQVHSSVISLYDSCKLSIFLFLRQVDARYDDADLVPIYVD